MSNRQSLLKNPTFQTLLSSLACIVLGLLIGYLVLLMINPQGAGEAIGTILLNWVTRASHAARIKALGNTIVKTAPLLLCALSVQFCYKVGLFNIGAAGQYAAGAGACLYAALAWKLPWFVCILIAMLAGGILGVISGTLKAYQNVNEVISGIMLNWITLYAVNMLLGGNPLTKDPASPYTIDLASRNPGGIIPSLGLDTLFSNNRYFTIAVPLAILIAIGVWVVLNKTKFGYELRATGFNKEAARYAGMKEKKNIILTLAIGGALAGLGAAFFFLTGYEKWSTTQTSVPGMGFNGIAATFLGGLHPIGTIFSSYFIQHITDGGALIDKSIYPSQISDLMSAIIIYLCAFVLFFKYTMNMRIARQEERVKERKMEEEAEGGENK